MKKAVCYLLATVLLSLMVIPAHAAEAGIQMTDITMQGEDMAYVTVAFTGKVTADAVGITYSYDETKLTALPEECAWSQKGMLSDFSSTGKEAVWAVSSAKSLTGAFCVLAFRIQSPQTFTKADVQCSVIVKNGGTTVGTFEAAATISKVCDHRYGSWTPSGSLGHVCVCEKCKAQQFQSHAMDSGVVSQDPASPGTTVKVFTCGVCGWTRTDILPDGVQENVPTLPAATSPTEPDFQEENHNRPQPTEPTSHTRPTDPIQKPGQEHQDSTHQHTPEETVNQPRDYNAPEQTESDADTPAGEHAPGMGDETAPMVIPVDKNASTSKAPDASQEGAAREDSGVNSAGIALAVIALLAAAGAGAWLFQKKRKA